ncbi:hypothetical protein ADL04_35175 [Streptomyces sp. NRRL B-3648]|nr:hypothetical protein ADL04_35175 [Streptomyces sp. NRRL B-3648]
MRGLVHEDGAGDLKQIEGDQVGGLLPGGALGPGAAEPGSVVQCREVQPAVMPDHQLGVYVAYLSCLIVRRSFPYVPGGTRS